MSDITPKTLQEAVQKLIASDFDLALGIREDTINDFLDAHFRVESQSASSVYKGGGHIDALKLGYNYDVKAPATIDIAPISKPNF